MKRRHAKLRNDRLWFENRDWLVLDKNGVPTLVEVIAMSGDSADGEVIYQVSECVSRQTYHASDRNLRKTKDRAETDALIAAARSALTECCQ